MEGASNHFILKIHAVPKVLKHVRLSFEYTMMENTSIFCLM